MNVHYIYIDIELAHLRIMSLISIYNHFNDTPSKIVQYFKSFIIFNQYILSLFTPIIIS